MRNFCTDIIPFSRLGGFYANLGSAEIFWPPKKGVLSTNVSQYKLYYFPVRGRGEAARYLLIDNDIKYEWINPLENKMEDWAAKYKPMTIFGQLPMLLDGDFKLCQSNAILRYLGRKHGLNAENVQAEARLDMIMDHVEDIRGGYSKMIYGNYEDGKDDYIKGLPAKFGPLEKLLKEWGNEQILTKITFADYNLFDILDNHLILAPDCLKEFPTVQAFHTSMDNRPKLKAYRDTEVFKNRPVNGNGKQ